MPTLHPDWRRIALRAWSVRLLVPVVILNGAEVICAVLTGSPPIEPVKFAMLNAAITMAATIARFVLQENMRAPE